MAVRSPEQSPRVVIEALDAWMRARNYASWDPYDGLTSPWLRGLMGRSFPARVALQLVKRSPLNLRPALGITPRVYTKALSDLVSALVLLHRLEGDAVLLERARGFAEQLRARTLTAPVGSSWGMDLPYVSRFTAATPRTPNLFQTVNVALAFLDLHECTGDERDLEPALGTVEWMQSGLGTLEATSTHVVWRYYPDEDAVVYNVNALAAALLGRLAAATGRDDFLSLAKRTLAFVTAEQNGDGSWYYARGANGRWVDGFHSGYVLESLFESVQRFPDPHLSDALERGMRFFTTRLLEPSGLPRYTDTSLYPIDAQNCAQAVQLLAKLGARDQARYQLARRVHAESARHLLVWQRDTTPAEAFVRFQHGRWWRNDLAAIRWSIAPMFLALAHLRSAEAAHAVASG